MGSYLGIDGGGSKTKCVLIDNDINILFEVEGTGSNPLVIGISKSVLVLGELINQANNSTGKKGIDSIVIGLAGAGRKTQTEKIKKEIQNVLNKEKIKFSYLEVVSDAEAALEGAFNGKPGAILISGTGSIIFGKDRKGKIQRAGGYGKIIGDEGSGYSIARKGLNAVAKEFDGSKLATLLTRILKDELEISDRDELINKIYSSSFDIAYIAKFVIECAARGDKICLKIIEREIGELIFQIKLLKKKINESELKLCLHGGIAGRENYFSRELKKKIADTFNDVIVKRNKYPAEIGAALLAKKLSNQN